MRNPRHGKVLEIAGDALVFPIAVAGRLGSVRAADFLFPGRARHTVLCLCGRRFPWARRVGGRIFAGLCFHALLLPADISFVAPCAAVVNSAAMNAADNLKARRLALNILTEVLDRSRRLDLALADGLRKAGGLSARDRAFAHNLSAGVIRRLGGLDFLLGRLMKRPLPARAAEVKRILELGLYQLLFLDVPDHAAVDTSVRLLGGRGQMGFKGLVNALLRRSAREKDALLVELDKTPEVYLAAWLAGRWKDHFGADALHEIIAVQLSEPPLDLTLKDPQETEAEAEKLGATILAPGRLRLREPAPPQSLPGFEDGDWWIQDVAASLPVTLFDDLDQTEVLDLCAAPGGKTLQLAAAGARVTAVDRSASRLKRLSENLARTGLDATDVEADVMSYSPDHGFRCVLLDAPCSATGTLRRHPDVMWRRGEPDIVKLAALQRRMLDRAFGWVAPGGSLVYCVCSLEPDEGSEQIAACLNRHPDARLVLPPEGWQAVLPYHATSHGVLTRPDGLAAAGGMDGFFMARIDKAI